jgi:hypothetical protein
MKRKGLTILVTMLAVVFVASTVYAGGDWWNYSIKQLWKKVSKIDKQTRWNTKKINQLDRKIDRKSKKWHKKKKNQRQGPKWGTDLEALKNQIKNELKADAAFKAELKGDPGMDGAMGPPGPDRARYCPGCNFSDTETDMLIGADFTNAFLFYSWFQGTDLTDANFTGANCKEASFLEASVAGTKFDGADLTNANMAGANWLGVNLAAADSVAGAKWVYSRYIGWDPAARQSIYEDLVAICPDGTDALNNGGTCEGHLSP